jgi:hypothetical protein
VLKSEAVRSSRCGGIAGGGGCARPAAIWGWGMSDTRTGWRRFRVVAWVAVIPAVVVVASVGGVAGASTSAPGHAMPNAIGELDCNGFSHIQRSVRPTMMCADPRLGSAERFEDNGHYIGHDEPPIRLLSRRSLHHA